MATVDDVRELPSGLPRSHEVLVRDRVKFRVGRIVYVAFSADETVMEVAVPKEEREGLVAAEPGKVLMPRPAATRSACASVRSRRPRHGSLSSMHGAWSCLSAWPPRTWRRQGHHRGDRPG